MNQPTPEEIWTWVTQHPEYERAKNVCPQCHTDCTGHQKVRGLGAPTLAPPTWLRCSMCRYEFGEREAALNEVVRIEAEKRCK